MELRQLRYFIALAGARSFSRAADNLHIAQSAVSRQIQSLEAELGVPLVIRGGQAMELTEAGTLFLRRAIDIIDDTKNLTSDVLAYADTPKGNLRVGVLPFTGEFLIPRVLTKYAREFRDVRIHLRSGVSSFIGEWVSDGRVDLGIMDSSYLSQALVAEPAAVGQMVLVLPNADLMSKLGIPEKEIYEVQDLKDYPLILTSVGLSHRRLIEEAASARGFMPNVTVEADNLGMIISLVRAGVGCAVLSYTTVHNALKQGGIRIAPLINPTITTDLSIVTRRGRPLTAAMRALIDHIKKEIKDLAEGEEIPSKYFKLAPSEGQAPQPELPTR